MEATLRSSYGAEVGCQDTIVTISRTSVRYQWRVGMHLRRLWQGQGNDVVDAI